MVRKLNFIDLFAGAGGLSEGFIRAGYTPLAHIEMDKYFCDMPKFSLTQGLENYVRQYLLIRCSLKK